MSDLIVSREIQIAPTVHQYATYQKAYDYFNVMLFGYSLKPCLLNFRSVGKKEYGFFWPKKWAKGDERIHEIALNPDTLHRPLIETFATLVHEMVHQWQEDHGKPPKNAYHNQEWASLMEAIGLMPSVTGEPGGKTTGAKCSHYVIPEGRYADAFARMPVALQLPWLTAMTEVKEKKPKKVSPRYKYACETCEYQVTSSKPDLHLDCQDCGQTLEPVDK